MISSLIKTGKNFLAATMVGLLSIFSLNAQMLADFETTERSPGFYAEDSTGVVDNPDKSGINSSDEVGYYNKLSGNWHFVSIQFPDTAEIRLNNKLITPLETWGTELSRLEGSTTGGDAYANGSYVLKLFHTWNGRFIEVDGKREQMVRSMKNSLSFTIPIIRIAEGHAHYIGQDVAFILEPAE